MSLTKTDFVSEKVGKRVAPSGSAATQGELWASPRLEGDGLILGEGVTCICLAEQDTCLTGNFCCLPPGRSASEFQSFGKHVSIPLEHMPFFCGLWHFPPLTVCLFFLTVCLFLIGHSRRNLLKTCPIFTRNEGHFGAFKKMLILFQKLLILSSFVLGQNELQEVKAGRENVDL